MDAQSELTKEQLEARRETNRVANYLLSLFARLGSRELSNVRHVREGVHPSKEFRLHYIREMEGGVQEPISPWHDIPLYVCEDLR